MADLKLTIGGDDLEERASQRFINAWFRAQKGETFRERHRSFESWDAFMQALRRTLVKSHPGKSKLR